ncbi:MAG: hypothetical protein RLZZ192_620, partial [Pseudomonadota bacterium]
MKTPSGKIKISFFIRKPHPGYNYSIERLFDAVIASLPADRYVVRVHFCPFEGRGLLRRLALILWAACLQSDVNHVTGDINFLGLMMRRSRTLLTITDSASMERLGAWKRWFYRIFWLQLPIMRAGHVAVISDATLNETMNYVRMDPAKVSVIPCCTPRGILAKPRPFLASRPRILAVGTHPNKNLPRIIEALAGLPCVLVIVGVLSESQQEIIMRSGLEVENHVHLDDAEITLQYQNADIVVFVSTYEGFGLPILEGQAAGRPVIVSRVSPMKEVAGAGACLVDPESVEEIREAVMRVINDSQYRAGLVRVGFENTRAYSPEIIARKYASVYESLFSGAAHSSEKPPENFGKKWSGENNRGLKPDTFRKTQRYQSDLVSKNVAAIESAPYGIDIAETHNDPVYRESKTTVIYLTSFVGPQVRAAREITTDSAAGSKKSLDMVLSMKFVGVKVIFLSFGWKRATWSLRLYPPMAESLGEQLVCEYAGQWDVPLFNFITSIVSVFRLVVKKITEEQATGYSCRLVVYNPSVQMTLVALLARLKEGIPIYLQLEDGTHLIPTVGILRRLIYYVSTWVLRRLISGVILVSPVFSRGYEAIPSVICRGVATDEQERLLRDRLDDPKLTSGEALTTFFFGSTLDEIRGVSLLLEALKIVETDLMFPVERCKFIITGKGPLENQVTELCRHLKRTRVEYMGFVNSATYKLLLSQSHVSMALQNPDHPYSRACFPSKVIEYMSSGSLVLT